MSSIRSGTSVAVAAMVALATLSSHAAADDVEEANVLFDRAEAARAEHRVAEARDLLVRSLELHASAPTAFNLAVLSAEMSRLLEAIALFDALLEGRYGTLGPEQQADVRARRRDAAESLVSLRVTATGSQTATVRVDGQPVGTLAHDAAVEVEVDPGRHVVAAAIGDDIVEEQAIDAERGGSRAISFDLSPHVLGGGAGASRPDDEDGSVLASPLFWGIAALVAAVSVGAALTIFFVTREPDRVVDPVLGNPATLIGP